MIVNVCYCTKLTKCDVAHFSFQNCDYSGPFSKCPPVLSTGKIFKYQNVTMYSRMKQVISTWSRINKFKLYTIRLTYRALAGHRKLSVPKNTPLSLQFSLTFSVITPLPSDQPYSPIHYYIMPISPPLQWQISYCLSSLFWPPTFPVPNSSSKSYLLAR